jgi:predicted PurR-regulated permease PerM
MNIPTEYMSVLIIILVIIVLVLIALIVNLNNKLKKFLIGSSSKNLDDSLTSMNDSIKELEKFRTELEKYLTTVEKRIKKSVQAVQTVRFNPFKGNGSGGNQSFATAFLNEDSNGVVISSLYSREHVSVYSKPIKNGVSEYELSEEEKQAISEARKIVKD